MEEINNYGQQIAYQKGYQDGFTEGLSKALQSIQLEMELCRSQRPIIIKYNCSKCGAECE